MREVLGNAIPLVDLVWQMETTRSALDTPERKAALIARLNERLKQVPSADVRRFYLGALAARMSRELGVNAYVYGDQLRASGASRGKSRQRTARPSQGFIPVSAALKTSRLTAPPRLLQQSAAQGVAKGPGDSSARRIKEAEILALILQAPEILERQHENFAALPLSDHSLDSLRHELLNLAASGFRLETRGLEDHLVRAGMAALVERLRTRRAALSVDSESARQAAGGVGVAGEIEERWLRAASQLREMAESGPERRQALERFKSEASEESWREWHRLVLSRVDPNE